MLHEHVLQAGMPCFSEVFLRGTMVTKLVFQSEIVDPSLIPGSDFPTL